MGTLCEDADRAISNLTVELTYLSLCFVEAVLERLVQGMLSRTGKDQCTITQTDSEDHKFAGGGDRTPAAIPIKD